MLARDRLHERERVDLRVFVFVVCTVDGRGARRAGCDVIRDALAVGFREQALAVAGEHACARATCGGAVQKRPPRIASARSPRREARLPPRPFFTRDAISIAAPEINKTPPTAVNEAPWISVL